MIADDLSAPLGQHMVKRRRRLPIAVPHVIAAALALFFALFVGWVIVGDGSFGGEPTVTVPIDRQAVKVVTKPEAMGPPQTTAAVPAVGQDDRPVVTEVPVTAPARPPDQAAPANTRTVTIIDGKTGARQEVLIPAATPGSSDSDEKPRTTSPPRHRGGEGDVKLKGSE